jgi:hypothetical protein
MAVYFPSTYTRVHPKYSELVPPSIQQLWYREAPVDGRTTMSSKSVWQVVCSWVDVGSFHTRLFGVVYFAIDSVREILVHFSGLVLRHNFIVTLVQSPQASPCICVWSLSRQETLHEKDDQPSSTYWETEAFSQHARHRFQPRWKWNFRCHGMLRC